MFVSVSAWSQSHCSLILLFLDTLRKRAWPKLVGLEKYSKPKESSVDPIHLTKSPEFEIDTALLTRPSIPSSIDLLVESMDKGQIDRDVERCTWHLLTGSQRSRRNQIKSKDKSKKISLLLKKKQRRLANLINLTLVESYSLSKEKLRYYQGYHDVACIFLHALGGAQSSIGSSWARKDPMGLDLASRVLCQVSFSHFRDNLRNNFVSLQTALKIALYPLLLQLDVQVHNHLQDCDMEPFFCLSWVLTWFSHDVRDTNLCKRIFDAFLASHPLFVIYVSLAMLLHPYNRKLILQTDCDFAALHHCLASLPRNSCKVGWKISSWERGYESDNDDEDDDKDMPDDVTTSTDMDTPSFVAPSTVSSRGSFHLGATTIEEGREQRVPFQDLIETALEYMARYPPRCLGDYARRYYGDESTNTNGISLLEDAPTWSLVSTAPADWVLKQRSRQELGLTSTSRKDRRRNAAAPKTESDLEDIDSTPDYEYLKRHSKDRAVIAAGYGPGPEAILERKKRHRLLATRVALGFLTMTFCMVFHHYTNDRRIISTDTSSNKAHFVKKLLEERRPNASMVSTTSELLSTSMVETADTVLEYCKLPIPYMLTVSAPIKVELFQKPNDHIAVANKLLSSSTLTSSSIQRPQQLVKRQVDPSPLTAGNTTVNTVKATVPASLTRNRIGGLIGKFTLNIIKFLFKPIRLLMRQTGSFLRK